MRAASCGYSQHLSGFKDGCIEFVLGEVGSKVDLNTFINSIFH